MEKLNEVCQKITGNPTAVAGIFSVIVLLLVLIVMQLWKIGYYKERLGNSGVEIPPDYWTGTDLTASVIPNQYVGNSTGGMTRGAAGRHGQENTSGTASPGDGRGYVYTTRLDDRIRSYNDTESPAFAAAHDESAYTGQILRQGKLWSEMQQLQ